MRRKKFSKLVTFCVDPLTYERLRSVTVKLDVSVSEFIRKAIVEKMYKEQT